MKTSDTLEASDGDAQVFDLGYLLDGEVIPNASCAIPNEFVYISQWLGSSNNVIEQVVEGLL